MMIQKELLTFPPRRSLGEKVPFLSVILWFQQCMLWPCSEITRGESCGSELQHTLSVSPLVPAGGDSVRVKSGWFPPASVSRQNVTGTIWCSFKCLRGHEWPNASRLRGSVSKVEHNSLHRWLAEGFWRSHSLSSQWSWLFVWPWGSRSVTGPCRLQAAAAISAYYCITACLGNSPEHLFTQSQLLILISSYTYKHKHINIHFSVHCVFLCVSYKENNKNSAWGFCAEE